MVLGAPMLATRIATAPHSLTTSTTLRHFFPLCALIVDSFANMSSGILLEMENICGNTERRAAFLWCLQRKPQLLGDAEETIHSASPHVAGKIPKCFVTVNIRAKNSPARSCLQARPPFVIRFAFRKRGIQNPARVRPSDASVKIEGMKHRRGLGHSHRPARRCSVTLTASNTYSTIAPIGSCTNTEHIYLHGGISWKIKQTSG